MQRLRSIKQEEAEGKRKVQAAAAEEQASIIEREEAREAVAKSQQQMDRLTMEREEAAKKLQVGNSKFQKVAGTLIVGNIGLTPS